MDRLAQLDEVLTELVVMLAGASPHPNWRKQRYGVMFTPNASVCGTNYVYELEDGTVDRGSSPEDVQVRSAINDIAQRHWTLTQQLGSPRWYKMKVSIERNGKYSVDFEYKDDYKEGDIMRDSALD